MANAVLCLLTKACGLTLSMSLKEAVPSKRYTSDDNYLGAILQPESAQQAESFAVFLERRVGLESRSAV